MEYGCIGEKLSHSFSKIIHNKLTDYDYELKEIPRDKLEAFMKEKSFKAINVTIPYKLDVIPFLDEISDTAKKIGAVNTVVNKNGRLIGFNTDFSGMRELILHNGMSLKDKKVLILGSGGTSKTAVAVAESLGAGEVLRVSRSEKAGVITYTEVYDNHRDAQVIINTTPCGMYPNVGGTAVDISYFKSLEAVIDAVYNPLSSALVVEAKKRGIKAVGGLYMLVAQGVFAAELFLDRSFPKTELQRIFSEIKGEKINIALIGMPGCGKSTIGKKLAEALGKEFIDSDEEIVNKTGMSIPEIFATRGEEYFRDVESQVISELSAKQGLIIATGGGAVVRSENVDLLKGNSVLCFLDRNIKDIVATADRPLSSNKEDLQKRYDERYDIYCSSADIKIECSNDVAANVTAIKEVFLSENFSN